MWRTVYDALFTTVKALPGVHKLVHHLAKHQVRLHLSPANFHFHSFQVPLSVATSSNSPAFNLKTGHHSGLFSLFDQLVLGDDPRVEHAKPAPDIFLTAAKELGQEPDLCLVLEDAPLGVAAGKAAGMQVVMVPDSRLAEAEKKEATLVLENLHQLNPADFGLPGYNYKPVTHVIFDMDGLLLNTQEMYSKVSAKILSEHGKSPDWEFKMKVIGRKAEEVAEMAVKHYGLPYTGAQYLDIHQVN